MRTKLLVFALLLASPLLAKVHVSVGIGLGVPVYGYYAPAPPPPPVVTYVRPAYPGPGYVWVRGYWYPVRTRYSWHSGYWARRPYARAYWAAPRYHRHRYYRGYWARR